MARTKECRVPICEKVTITVSEACDYSSIGMNKMRELVNDPLNTFTIHMGGKVLIRRAEFEEFLRNTDSI